MLILTELREPPQVALLLSERKVNQLIGAILSITIRPVPSPLGELFEILQKYKEKE